MTDEKSKLNMSGPIASACFSSDFKKDSQGDSNHKIGKMANMMLKTTTMAISPMNISTANSTKNKYLKRGNLAQKNKLIEHKKAKMSFENFKRR